MKPWRSLKKLRSLKRLVGIPDAEPVPAPRRESEHPAFQIMPTSTQQPTALDCEYRLEIISAYGRVLEQCASAVEPEAALPYPKELIRQAIYDELAENPETDLREHLEIAFVRLESFLPSEEFEIVHNFKLADSLAREMAKSGIPGDIISSARILKDVKGERAVEIQEKVSEEMQKRLGQIRATGSSGPQGREYS